MASKLAQNWRKIGVIFGGVFGARFGVLGRRLSSAVGSSLDWPVFDARCPLSRARRLQKGLRGHVDPQRASRAPARAPGARGAPRRPRRRPPEPRAPVLATATAYHCVFGTTHHQNQTIQMKTVAWDRPPCATANIQTQTCMPIFAGDCVTLGPGLCHCNRVCHRRSHCSVIPHMCRRPVWAQLFAMLQSMS